MKRSASAFVAASLQWYAEPRQDRGYNHQHQAQDHRASSEPLHPAHAFPRWACQHDFTAVAIRGCEKKSDTFRSKLVSSIDISGFQFVLRRGVASCPANQASGAARRRARTSEQLFFRNFQKKNSPNSAAWSGPYGLTTLPPISQSARRAPNVTPASSSRGSANRTPASRMRSWARLSVEIPATALGTQSDRPRSQALYASGSAAGVDTPSLRGQALEGRGPVEDWTDGCLAVRAVIYPARRGASHRAPNFRSAA